MHSKYDIGHHVYDEREMKISRLCSDSRKYPLSRLISHASTWLLAAYQQISLYGPRIAIIGNLLRSGILETIKRVLVNQ